MSLKKLIDRIANKKIKVAYEDKGHHCSYEKELQACIDIAKQCRTEMESRIRGEK